eukprot:CAMPEP_0177640980 /NCGR_PEP_ID=MMETSP0447-20121125/6830_1 /TAXON_ID=0 /ORGANISM="Stygamoeba regulata, Strain BSH-02190019" /LENGTH=735 /DNA_ID=CAMNT_0019143083 /DNA_START=298 /DNA_END=2505 /DNA_ORIENTATION=-
MPTVDLELIGTFANISNAAENSVIFSDYCKFTANLLLLIENEITGKEFRSLDKAQVCKLKHYLLDGLALLRACTSRNWLRLFYMELPSSPHPQSSSDDASIFKLYITTFSKFLQECGGVSSATQKKWTTAVDSLLPYEGKFHRFMDESMERMEKNIVEEVKLLMTENFKTELEAIKLKMNELSSNATTSKEKSALFVLKRTHEILQKDTLFENPAEKVRWDMLSGLQLITKGSTNEVYKARRCGERVCVKKNLNQTPSKEEVEKFHDLLRLESSFRSGFIVRLFGASLHDPLFTCFEFMEKGTLFDVLHGEDAEPLTWEIKWQMASDAALALSYLHFRKPPVLHRDINSRHFLVRANLTLKLGHFAQAQVEAVTKPMSARRVCTNQFVDRRGNTRWAAPEVLEHGYDSYTKASEVFSYGLLLCELATQQIPFHTHTSVDAVKAHIIKGEVPSLPEDTPNDFKTLVEMCLQKQPGMRSTLPQIVKFLREQGYMANKTKQRKGAVKKLKKETEKQQSELTLQMQLTERAKAEHDELDRKLRYELEQVQNAEFRRDELQQRIHQLEEAKAAEVERVRKEIERKTQLDREIKAALEAKVKKLEKKLTRRTEEDVSEIPQEQIDQWERQLDAEKKKNQALQMQLTEQEQKVKEAHWAKDSLQRDKTDAERRFENERRERADLEAKLKELETARAKAEKKLERTKKRYESMEEDSSSSRGLTPYSSPYTSSYARSRSPWKG